MAEMDTSGGGKHKKGPGVKKAKKLSTRVDLTPMVDLGFLLLTFFIFTTTMSQPTAMNLPLPDDSAKPEEQNKAKESGTLTLMIGKNSAVYYYEGQLAVDASQNNFKSSTMKQIRDVIINKKKSVLSLMEEKDFVVVIKPNADATYKDLVDILDEMLINDVKRYALVDITDVENQLIKLTEGSGETN
jgi:biopolymer transport protein ExbD